MSTRLDTISHNNKRNRVRDVMFACFIMLAAALAITAIQDDVRSHVAQSR